jgi:DNA transformation protein
MAAKADPHRFDDLFAPFGRIVLRRMFGGEGIYADSLMFGLVVDDRIYFKTDDLTRAAYVAEQCDAFTYGTKDGRHVSLSYFAIPERLYDDPEELAGWARRAHAVARAKPKAKPKPKLKAKAKPKPQKKK